MKRFKLLTTAMIAMLSLSSNIADAQWVRKDDIATFAQGRWSPQTFVVNNKIYVGGGYVGNFSNYNDLQEYDPVNDSWTLKNGLPGNVTSRTSGISFVINGKAYVGLGAQDFNSFNPSPTYLADLWEYDATNDTWTQKASLPDSGRTETAFFVANNKVYVVGGTTGGFQYSNDTWEYNPATDQWTAKTPFPMHRVHKALAVSIDNKGYITCGSAGWTQYNHSTYEYNPTTDSWTQKADFPTGKAKYGGVAFAVGGKMYAGLGKDSLVYNNDFFVYDPQTDVWRFLDDNFPAHERQWSTAIVFDGKAYVGGGWHLENATGTQTFYRDWYQVNPADLLNVKALSKKTLSVYPNPATDKINVSVDVNTQYRYTLYSIVGQQVLTGELTNNTIDVSNVPTGSYILELHSSKEVLRQTVIISEK